MAANGYFKRNSDGTIDCVCTELECVDVTASGTITGDVTGDITGDVTGEVTQPTTSVTATFLGVDVTKTGSRTFVAVTSSTSADHIVKLPAPVVGDVVWLYVGANGYELRTSDPETIAINGGTGVNAESAIAASTLTRCVCTSATTWVCTDFAANGTVSATEVAA